MFEFHVSKAARDRYSFDQALFAFNGEVVFANPVAARQFANRMNIVREVVNDPARAARPADLYAMGLIDEALHILTAVYRRKYDPAVMNDALRWFEERIGREEFDHTLLTFVNEFPPVPVYSGTLTPQQWLAGTTEGTSHRAVALEEVMMLWLGNSNPAYRPYTELFDESLLRSTAYRGITNGLRDFFETRPRYGARKQNLFDVLRAPALASPESLAGQLAYLQEEFKEELAELIQHFLRALDVIKEEEIATWSLFHPPGQQRQHPGTPLFMGGDSSMAAIPHFGEKEPEYERFSPDVDWMPSTVLLAKTVYVWLDQLSKQYGRHIHRLDQIPDEELSLIARRGFNSLWFIGIWQRSTASRTIKQLMGNPDAAASAYSLFDYRIADDLGGEDAYANLRDRAAQRGIRLASDMVPNHMGIDSQWVIDHPDWFLSLNYSPYPAYSFNGPDLSSDGRVEIKLEDHYYDRSDAAVVFRRSDRWTGDTRYIYHGNDGTTFPWNDTAQLNYLNPEVREAVIQTIIHVAKMFPIIRFDAAMTLAKQHYQRLWFPAPGTGGAIPSRAEHGMTKPDFDRAMPHEFWREVVDRIAVEVPGTLLLAEAFWLLEGYFVRTLGMHRVYNSAFMNMMRDEENANYRSVLKNTLEFDPDVLKRYVNFMNNPDERTAVDQFGKGDKYFGVCTLLSTLPGLPMFGHGQIEGYTERYGMEFRRAQRDEQSDSWLVGRHEREITPLLHRRPLFAEVENFLLYDFYTDSGHVNEDVFAYSNRRGNERGLVIYHNRYADTQGWVRMSCSYAEKQADGSKRNRQRSLAEGLGLAHDAMLFVAYRDAFTGQEFIHRSSEIVEKGLRVQLGAYKTHVFLDWRELRDDASHHWSALCDHLQGRGVPSLEDELRWLELRPLHYALTEVMDHALISALSPSPTVSSGAAIDLAPAATEESTDKPRTKAIDQHVLRGSASSRSDSKAKAIEAVVARSKPFFAEVQKILAREAAVEAATTAHRLRGIDVEEAVQHFRALVQAAAQVPLLEAEFKKPWPAEAVAVIPSNAATSMPAWGATLSLALIEAARRSITPPVSEAFVAAVFDAARLRHPIAHALANLGAQGEEGWRGAARVRFAFAHPATVALPQLKTGGVSPLSWVNDPEVAWLIGAHDYQGDRYFNKELFERLLWWMALRPMLEAAAESPLNRGLIAEIEEDIRCWSEAAEKSGYRVEALLESGGV